MVRDKLLEYLRVRKEESSLTKEAVEDYLKDLARLEEEELRMNNILKAATGGLAAVMKAMNERQQNHCCGGDEQGAPKKTVAGVGVAL